MQVESESWSSYVTSVMSLLYVLHTMGHRMGSVLWHHYEF